MRYPNVFPTGFQSITGKAIICSSAVEYYSIMNLPEGVNPLSQRKPQNPLLRFKKEYLIVYTLAISTQNEIGGMLKSMLK